MKNLVKAKLVEISEPIISIQNQDATLFDYFVEIDSEILENYKKIQRDFMRMQNELENLISKNLRI